MATVSGLTQYFLEGVISNFADKLAPLNAFTMNVNVNGAVENDVIRVPYSDTTDAAQTFSYNTGYATTGSTVTSKNITLDNFYYKRWDINDAEYVQLTEAAARRHGERQGQALASKVMNGIWTQVSSSNYTSASAYSGSSFTTQAVWADLQKVANELKWPDERAVIANADLYYYTVTNTGLVNYAYGSPTVVQTGRLPQYFGFDIYQVNNLPTNGADGLMGFAATPDGILVGMAYHTPQPGINYNVAQQMTDAETGLTLGYREWGNEQYARVERVIDVLEGHQVGLATGCILIKTTP